MAGTIPVLLILAILLVSAAPKTEAYIMPAEQVIHLMTERFSGFKTLKLIQTAHIIPPHNKSDEIIIEEKLYLKAPYFFYLQSSGLPPAGRSSTASGARTKKQETIETAISRLQERRDMGYRRLLLAGDETSLIALLIRWGVDPARIAFTRLEGKVAYRLGGGRPESPVLLVEKDRLLPLLIRYPLESDSGTELVSIHFEKYRRLKQGWYPYEIYYHDAQGNLLASYKTSDLAVNLPIEVPLAPIALENTRPPRLALPSATVTSPDQETETDDRTLQEKRLQEIIIDLQEKYQ